MKTGSDASALELSGPLYFDASALVKLYLPEPDSASLNRLVAGRRDALVSDLVVTEIVSSLCRRRREGSVSPQIVDRVRREILSHLDDGVYARVELVPAVHREAERLLASIDKVALRAADALHLALALSGGAATVLTFDRRLADAARASGLGVHP